MAIVGSEIFWNGMATGFSGEQIVSPMWMSVIPEIATIDPMVAFLYLNLLETVKLIKLCDADSLGLGIIVMVDDNNILIYTDGTVIDLADSDTSDIFIVINCADQHLCAGIRIALRSRNIIEDRIKQRNHVLARLVCTVGSDPFLCGCINKWAVELLLVGIQINEKLQDFIDNLLRTRLRTVDPWLMQTITGSSSSNAFFSTNFV